MKLGIRESIDKIRTFSRTFVERPRFAMVISIVLTMAGVMAIKWLPISQYPRLTPPSISVTYSYPGANAKEILNTVAMPIEDEVNGVDDMLYMVGSCSDTGTYTLQVSFEVESDRDMDMVKVQNRVAQAEAKLPTEVKQLGGRIRAQAEDMLGVMALRSPKGTMSRLQISDYIYGNIQPVLLRIPGVGEAMFSITSSPTQTEYMEFSIKRCGCLTTWLHGIEPEQQVLVRGPYGNGFPVEGAFRGKDLLFIAGGIGLAPLRSVVNYCRAHRDNYGHRSFRDTDFGILFGIDNLCCRSSF